jgi:hypothetical protein
VPAAGSVDLRVYDVLGREVAVLVNERTPAGTFTVTWDATSEPTGVYLYKLSAGTNTQTRKMVLAK